MSEKAESGFTKVLDPYAIELDKSRDGRYWYLLHWPGNDVLLRLRIVHLSFEEPNDVIAELKRFGPDDPAGRSDEGFTILGRFMCCSIELEEPEPDLDEFPQAFRDEFITMMRYWGRILELMECGSALGSLVGAANGG